jgi:hypothetical protein
MYHFIKQAKAFVTIFKIHLNNYFSPMRNTSERKLPAGYGTEETIRDPNPLPH